MKLASRAANEKSCPVKVRMGDDPSAPTWDRALTDTVSHSTHSGFTYCLSSPSAEVFGNSAYGCFCRCVFDSRGL
jgi:hypothetical protein